jgi:two-component system sensor histidine kinase MtrB
MTTLRVRRWGQALDRRWRRSIQFRVVTTTLLVSAVVVALLGVFLLGAVRNGLIDAKQKVALAQAGSGSTFAQKQLNFADRTEPDALDTLVNNTVEVLARSGGTALSGVVLLESDAELSTAVTGLSSCDLSCESSVPRALRSYVESTGKEGYIYTRIHHADAKSEPGLVVGTPVFSKNGSYELYYLFPLAQESDTLALVQRVFVFGGIALVFLLAGIAWLVTRQVVAPVRSAALTAERFAAGRLQERMVVHGEDDLARLATSFNAMAAGLQEQIRQLEELSRVQRQFVSDVSHELRTPLTTVRMAADVLHENRAQFDPAVSRSAELLQAQLDRFEALLVDLLEISRHDAGAVALDADQVDVRTLVDAVVAAAEPLAARRGSVLRVQAPDVPVVSEVDARRIERVLRNLVVNAIEHGEGKPIDVHIGADSDAVAVSVRDHGVGLSPEEAAMVFNRFWRADPARARTTGGTGLGLSISVEDAHLHGGWLQAWGRPGQGALFRLTVPRREGSTVLTSPLPLVPDDAGTGDVPPAATDSVETLPADADRTAASQPGRVGG